MIEKLACPMDGYGIGCILAREVLRQAAYDDMRGREIGSGLSVEDQVKLLKAKDRFQTRAIEAEASLDKANAEIERLKSGRE